MSFEKDHRTFTGCCAASFALLAERLRVDAVGVNCSLGPDELLPIVEEMAAYTNLPLIVKANAGLPDPLTNTYAMQAHEFANSLQRFTHLPIRYIYCRIKTARYDRNNGCEKNTILCLYTNQMCNNGWGAGHWRTH